LVGILRNIEEGGETLLIVRKRDANVLRTHRAIGLVEAAHIQDICDVLDFEIVFLPQAVLKSRTDRRGGNAVRGVRHLASGDSRDSGDSGRTGIQ